MEWIDVKKKLPPIGKDKFFPYCSDVILITDGKNVLTGFYESHPFGGTSWMDTQCNDLSDKEIKKIKFWMPLPNPPKK